MIYVPTELHKSGTCHLRAELGKSVGERVWFAGEVCSPDLWATVAGAHKSGIRTAKGVVAALSSQKLGECERVY